MAHNVLCERCGGEAGRTYQYRWPDQHGGLTWRLFIECVNCGVYPEGSAPEFSKESTAENGQSRRDSKMQHFAGSQGTLAWPRRFA
jgi:hypothetical protein